ncbi:MAG: hypothetical protein ACE5SW_08670 [Nitrososphaeraceae archaeon]
MFRLVAYSFKYSILATTIVLFTGIGISGENVHGQTSNETAELEEELRMEQQELEEQLKETVESFNETQTLEGMG